MAKPGPMMIPSDDFEWTRSDGKAFKLHEGEWVEAYRSVIVGDQNLQVAINAAQARLKAAEGDDDETEQVVKILDEINLRMCARIASGVVAWTWTDDKGNPYPQPDGTAEFFLPLRQAEVQYLLGLVISNETEAERKNDSRPLPTTSSATPRVRNRK